MVAELDAVNLSTIHDDAHTFVLAAVVKAGDFGSEDVNTAVRAVVVTPEDIETTRDIGTVDQDVRHRERSASPGTRVGLFARKTSKLL